MGSKNLSSKEKLIVAARRSLLDLGHGATTVKAVSRLAGVNHGLVHHYFGSKEGLMVAVLEKEDHQLRVLMDSEGKESVMDVLVHELLHNSELPRLLIEFYAMADQMPLVAGKIREILRHRMYVLEEKIGLVQPGQSLLVAGAILGLSMIRQVDSEAPVEKVFGLIKSHMFGETSKSGK